MTTTDKKVQQAVCIRHGYKHYGRGKIRQDILKDLNMSVNIGTIYGLLGASGCGKTTLLSIVVGIKKLDKGNVWVLGTRPGSSKSEIPGKAVGYMPQEIALYADFSVKETMIYFGFIFDMKLKDVRTRLEFLQDLLQLPGSHKLIRNLSGGQQRRVSFGVALLHDPQILILDEPTVGVDPVLRQKIWTHLVEISKGGNKTVIITTHYIEEAGQAHMIGLMREGKLLAEESPQKLLSSYKCNNLEDVFLLLSVKQQNEEQLDDPLTNLSTMLIRGQSLGHLIPDDEKNVSKDSWFKRCSCRKIANPGHLIALFMKNFLRLVRNIGLLVFLFLVPLVQVVLFNWAIGRDPSDLAIAVVNFEAKYISETKSNCPIIMGCSEQYFSCRYLKHLKSDIISDLKYFKSEKAALKAVKDGGAWGYLVFHHNFSQSAVLFFNVTLNVSNEALQQSQIYVAMDMSNSQVALRIQAEINLAYLKFSKDMLILCHANPSIADIPIFYKEPIFGHKHPSFTDFVAAGIILTIVFFLAVAGTSNVLIQERSEGMFNRSWVAGMSSCEIFVAHIVTQFIIMFIQSSLVIIFMIWVFTITCKGDLFWVMALTLMEGFVGMSFGFFISAVCNNETDAVQASLGSFYPVLLLSGTIWPIEGMHKHLRHFAMLLPLTLPTKAMRTMLVKGFGINNPAVYMGFVVCFVWASLFFILTFIFFKIKKS